MRLNEIADYMREHGLKLVTAESCTAGLIAARLADVPGTGELLDCAFVTYSPQAKQRCLAVAEATIARYNLTSEEVAREMALGAIACSPANLAIANTGVSDDTDPDIAAGTQCFAWLFSAAAENLLYSETRRFTGDRNQIRKAAALYALERIPHYHQIAIRDRKPSP